MNIDIIRKSLIRHEGIKYKPYLDAENVWTVAIGHNMNKPLSRAAVDQIFQDDINESINELDRKFTGWNSHSNNVQNVLIEMQFNLGAPRLASFKKMWAALKEKDYHKAALEMLDSKWADQVGERATNLASIMANG